MRTPSPSRRRLSLVALGALALALAACSSEPAKRKVKTGSVSVATVGLMGRLDMSRSSPILMRVFKEEAVLEVWKQERNGRYGLLRTYPICKFSGKLGPKLKEGDRQAPEGFYAVNTRSLNPWSRNHLAFNIGFPNAFDRQLGRTGSHLMVHGGCNSVGCYAMTHKRIEEIYGLLREALVSGQTSVPFQAFPFRMTAENMQAHADDPNMPFWENLKVGHDMFEQTRRPPRVFACGSGAYGFASGAQAASPDAAAFACDPRYASAPPLQTYYGVDGSADASTGTDEGAASGEVYESRY